MNNNDSQYKTHKCDSFYSVKVDTPIWCVCISYKCPPLPPSPSPPPPPPDMQAHINSAIGSRSNIMFILGVDHLDQHMSYYHFIQKAIKWWRKVIEVASVNAYIIYTKYSICLPTRGFIEKLSCLSMKNSIRRDPAVQLVRMRQENG